ncbi:hypothetical protein HOF92_01605 [bacterium]|nr:hypothetical protein [bacterium]
MNSLKDVGKDLSTLLRNGHSRLCPPFKRLYDRAHRDLDFGVQNFRIKSYGGISDIQGMGNQRERRERE